MNAEKSIIHQWLTHKKKEKSAGYRERASQTFKQVVEEAVLAEIKDFTPAGSDETIRGTFPEIRKRSRPAITAAGIPCGRWMARV